MEKRFAAPADMPGVRVVNDAAKPSVIRAGVQAGDGAKEQQKNSIENLAESSISCILALIEIW